MQPLIRYERYARFGLGDPALGGFRNRDHPVRQELSLFVVPREILTGSARFQRRKIFFFLVLCLLLLGAVLPVIAQTFYGSLVGRLSDSRGTGITGALIILW